MEKQQFKATIAAPREKIWNILWNKDTYPKWTAVFAEGSKAETDWKNVSKILFVDGTGSGMVSRVENVIPNEYMSIEHLGVVKNGVEDTTSDEVKGWAGAHENYTLKTMKDKTELTIDMDMTDEFKEYFLKTWPLALEKVKELAERES